VRFACSVCNGACDFSEYLVRVCYYKRTVDQWLQVNPWSLTSPKHFNDNSDECNKQENFRSKHNVIDKVPVAYFLRCFEIVAVDKYFELKSFLSLQVNLNQRCYYNNKQRNPAESCGDQHY
jgi:hypothetical protein